MADESLDLLMKFILDPDALKRVEDGISSVTEELTKMGATEKEIKEVGEELHKLGFASDETNKILTGKVQKGLADTEQQAKKTTTSLMQVRMALNAINQVARVATVAGGVIYGGIMGLAAKYVNDAKTATAVTEAWKAAQEDLNKSMGRLGASAAKAALPIIQKSAELMAKVADIVDKHPEMVTAALNIGMALLAVGAIGTAVSRFAIISLALTASAGVNATASTKMVQAAALNMTASQRMMTAARDFNMSALKGGYGTTAASKAMGVVSAVTLLATSLIVGGMAGLALGNWLNEMIYGKGVKVQNWADIGNTLDRMGRMFGMLIFNIASGKGATFAGDYGVPKGYEKYNSSLPAPNSVEQLTADFIAFLKTVPEFMKNYRAKTLSIEQDFTASMTALALKRKSLMTEYAEQELEAEQDYYRQRSQMVMSYSIEVQRAEEDHQKEMRRMLEEHNDRVTDLVASRDAMGLVRENRAYEKQRKNAEDDYAVQAARRSEDFARQLAEMEANFRLQRQQRAKAYAQRMRDLQEEEYKIAETRRLALLQALDDYRYFFDTLKALAKQLSDAAKGIVVPTPTRYANGGYKIFEKEAGQEFVLSNRTTQIAENAVGGRLNQEAIVAALMGNRSNYSDHRRLEFSNMTESDRLWVRNVIRRETEDVIAGAFQ